MGFGHIASVWKDYADRMLIWANTKTGVRNFKIVTGGTGVNNDPLTDCSGAIFCKKS